MRFGRVDYENFGPFEKASVNFAVSGLTAIEGIIEGRPGCGSNGSGKSYLQEGPTWAVFGRCIRADVKGDDVVRDGSKGGTMVRSELLEAGPNNSTVVVTRYRKHKKFKDRVFLEVDGEDVTRGTNPQTDAAILDIIGMDFTTYVNAVVFGSREEVVSFFAATDKERKQVMETLLGLGDYTAAEKVARQRLREATDALNDAESAMDTNASRLEDAEESLHAASATTIADDDVRLKGRKLVVRNLDARIAAVTAERQQAMDQLNDATEEHLARQAQRDEEVRAAEKIRDGYEEAAEAERRQAKLCERDIEALRRKMEKLSNVAESDEGCPTCLQVLPEDKAEAARAELSKQITALGSKADLHEMQATTHDRDAEEVVIPDEDVPEPVEMDTYRTEVDHCTELLAKLGEQRKDAQIELDRILSVKASRERVRNQAKVKVDKLKDEGVRLQQVHEKAREQCDNLTFWVEGFGNKGLKSFLIEAELPAINKAATKIAQRLLGRGSRVQLNATRELKTKAVRREEMSVTGSIPGLTRTYAQASKGQKKRMDLSLLLAFREIAARRVSRSFDQLFVDELFDGLDPEGSAFVTDLLRDTSEECPVILVTHDPQLKSSADRVITVRHNGDEQVGTAVVENGG